MIFDSFEDFAAAVPKMSAMAGLDLGVTGTLIVILALYLVLGCFLEGFAMLVLTLPIFFPVILDLGIDPIWFGVLVVLTLEMGLISPPVGINVFIVKSVAPGAELGQIFRGVLPFIAADIVRIALIVLILVGGREWSSKIPFGPYIAVAGLIALLWGDKIIQTYLRSSGLGSL